MTIGYLGPCGTFSEQAAKEVLKHMQSENKNFSCTTKPLFTIEDVLTAVLKDEIAFGVAPMENSIEGMINQTLDALIVEPNLFISSQHDIHISQHMMVQKNKSSQPLITTILSHPQGIAQCRKFIYENYPMAKTIAVSSTSEAARLVAEKTDADGEGFAAICNALCEDIYGLKMLHKNIQTDNTNTTTFVNVTKQCNKQALPGYKTSIAFSVENKPGSLFPVLNIFSLWDLNLTKIVSRPIKTKPGDYFFYVEFINNENVCDSEDALTMVARKANFFKHLGSYPHLNCID